MITIQRAAAMESGWYVNRTGTVYSWCRYCGDMVVLYHGKSTILPQYPHNTTPLRAGFEEDVYIKSLLDRSTIISSQLKTKKMAKAEQRRVTAVDIKNDPAFERTRENMAEFARGGKAGRLIRAAFRELLVNIADKEVSSRLVRHLMRVLYGDSVSVRGERKVQNGNLSLLQGFNFNHRASLTETMFVQFGTAIDRATGVVTVSIPSFVPRALVIAGRGTTHYKIRLGAAAFDFDNNAHTYVQQSTNDLPWDASQTAPINLSVTLPANSPHPIVAALAIEFSQSVNAGMYPLKSGSYNAAGVIGVSKAA